MVLVVIFIHLGVLLRSRTTMVEYTNPISTAFELQRKSLENSHQAIAEAVEFQQRMSRAAIDGLDTQETTQRHAVELHQEFVHDALDSFAATVPGADTGAVDARETIDEGYAQFLETHEELFATFVEEFGAGVETYDELTADYLAAVEEQLDLFVETHEDLEDQWIEAAEEVGEQVEDLQEQVDEVQAQIQDVSEQAAEAVDS